MSKEEQHQLEKATLESAFESDAYDGWAEHAPDEIAQDLDKLRKRIRPSDATWRKYWIAAASITLILGAAVFLFSLFSRDQPVIAEAEKTAPEQSIKSESEKPASASKLDKPESALSTEPSPQKKLEPAQEQPASASPGVRSSTIPAEDQSVDEVPVSLQEPSNDLADNFDQEPSSAGEVVSLSETEDDLFDVEESAVQPAARSAKKEAASEDFAFSRFSEQEYTSLIVSATSSTGEPLTAFVVFIDDQPADSTIVSGRYLEISLDLYATPFQLRVEKEGYKSQELLVEDGDSVNLVMEPQH